MFLQLFCIEKSSPSERRRPEQTEKNNEIPQKNSKEFQLQQPKRNNFISSSQNISDFNEMMRVTSSGN